MAQITLISDIGNQSFQLARVKARLKQRLPAAQMTVIKQDISRHDVSEAAFVLSNCLEDFLPGTIHLVDVDADIFTYKRLLLASYRQQWILAVDNAFFSLLFPEKEAEIYEVDLSGFAAAGNFALLHVYLDVAARLEQEGTVATFAQPTAVYLEKTDLKPVVEEKSIRGTVIYVDEFGNAITNITQPVFEAARKNRRFNIRLNRHEQMDRIFEHYGQTEIGEKICLWTEKGYLQVAINRGDASRLLGLVKSKMISIEFE